VEVICLDIDCDPCFVEVNIVFHLCGVCSYF
jgi:hypothetical protein